MKGDDPERLLAVIAGLRDDDGRLTELQGSELVKKLYDRFKAGFFVHKKDAVLHGIRHHVRDQTLAIRVS